MAVKFYSLQNVLCWYFICKGVTTVKSVCTRAFITELSENSDDTINVTACDAFRPPHVSKDILIRMEMFDKTNVGDSEVGSDISATGDSAGSSEEDDTSDIGDFNEVFEGIHMSTR